MKPVVGLVVPDMTPRNVVGRIGAIDGRKIVARFASLVGPAKVAVEIAVDPGHPITKAMMERLPRLDDAGVVQVLAFLKARDPRACGAMSTPAQVEGWIGMVEEEISYRARERRGLLDVLSDLFAVERASKK